MDINTTELDFITDKLTAALTRPLEERIAQLESENSQLQEMLAQSKEALTVQGMTLAAKDMKIQKLMAEVESLRSEHGNEVVTAMYYAKIIPLSKPAARQYVVKIDNNRDRFCIAHFLQQTLANDIPQQLADEVRQMTQLPEPKAEAPRTVNNNFAAGSSSQVMNGPVNNSTFNTPPTE